MYVLGEKIIDYEFQNAVIQAMMSDISRTNVLPSLGTVKIIYDGTTEESAARRLLVDMAPPENFEMLSLREDVVPIQVGCDKTSLLRVHTGVLIKSSEMLKNVIKTEWRTDATKPIDMSDVELTIFEAYCGWLYTGKIVRSKEDDCFSLLAKLYVLGEKLMDTAFKSAIIAAIMRSKIDRKMYPCTRAVQIIYAGTPGSSPARRLMVYFWVFSAGPTWNGLSDLIEGTCPDFVNDLARELIVTRDRPDDFVQRPWIEDLGSYRVDSETK
ncbi:unnamed protein product [Alternaria sp. RS040]